MARPRLPRARFCTLACVGLTLLAFGAGYYFYRFIDLTEKLNSLRSGLQGADEADRARRLLDLSAETSVSAAMLERPAEDSRALLLSWRNASMPVENIGSPQVRAELKRVLSLPEGTKNSRAAFEKVVALSSLLPRMTEIARMKTPSPKVFREYVAPVGLPVVFTDMFEGEKLSRWSWDYVRSKWGKTKYLNIRQGNYSTKTSKSGKHLIHRVSVTLEDFIDMATGKKKVGKNQQNLYIAKRRVIPLEALEAEFYYPPFYPGAHDKCYLEPSGWIGTPGTFTQGHIDSKDNFVYQIIGRKRWTIFSPQDYKFLYYTRGKGSLEWSAALNSFDASPDLEKFPLYRRATPVSFVMSPGEVLYLPRGWTHTVANLTPNLMINVWRYGPAAITQRWMEESDRAIRELCY